MAEVLLRYSTNTRLSSFLSPRAARNILYNTWYMLCYIVSTVLKRATKKSGGENSSLMLFEIIPYLLAAPREGVLSKEGGRWGGGEGGWEESVPAFKGGGGIKISPPSRTWVPYTRVVQERNSRIYPSSEGGSVFAPSPLNPRTDFDLRAPSSPPARPLHTPYPTPLPHTSLFPIYCEIFLRTFLRRYPSCLARCRSRLTVSSTPGRCTLTATDFPFDRSVAL